jgi:hypothetical protein
MIDISENARTMAVVVEVYCPESMPEFDRHTAQQYAYVFLANVVDAIGAGNRE